MKSKDNKVVDWGHGTPIFREKTVFITFLLFVYIVRPIFSFSPFVTDTVILDLFAFYRNSKIHKSRFYIYSV